MLKKFVLNKSFLIFILFIILSIYVGSNVSPTYTIEKIYLDVQQDQSGSLYFTQKGKKIIPDKWVMLNDAELHPTKLLEYTELNQKPTLTEEYIYEISYQGRQYFKYQLKKHWRFWSLLPALLAIILCWTTKEPLAALFSGIVVGAFILGQYNITDEVIIPVMMSKSVVGVLVLYLFFLGALLGLWTKTGAAKAFAELMSEKFVRGPKSAKLISWIMGILFFQGGTISTVLVGTTVKPITDKENISHEELAYIVDSTASPIASQLAFNAWPSYIQTFIFVSGVSWLATEADRIAFFFITR